VYFLFNESEKPFSHAVTLKSSGRKAESWDAQNGTISPLSASGSAGELKLALELKPYETRLIVVR